ncbi:MAG: hypothetical protein JRH01_02730 [Deltaproteobacteria bacterium]|nr:hypothetical protein [Deltaproteobacteria bacterium]MBW2394385.1 hypothetical protein [Deltaproteobacteria bacterium]
MRVKLVVALIAALTLAAPVAAEPTDLLGTWHVLVHYKDKITNNPDTERWEDRIWVFKTEGSRMAWSDYPIVVFDEKKGRFDNSSGRNSRVLHFWEPNAAQLSEIHEGLAINQRGARTKRMKGSPAEGWTSAKGRRGYRSLNVVTFEETWTIEMNGDLPKFIRDDVMGSASTESMEGRTQFETETIEDGGNTLRGRFERDGGDRAGTFRLTRSGSTRSVGSSGKTLQDKVSSGERLNLMLAGHLTELPGEHDEDWYRAKIEDGTLTQDDRFALRAAFEQRLKETLGSDTERTTYRVIMQNLARKMERLFVEDGKSMSDLRKMLRDGQLKP